jgi:hypothetical protein
VIVLYTSRRIFLAILCVVISAALPWADAFSQSDPLPSWNEGAAKRTIVDFVTRVTTQRGAKFVPVPKRIATFDNDGTLWCEQPYYSQVAFAFDRIKAMAQAK